MNGVPMMREYLGQRLSTGRKREEERMIIGLFNGGATLT
jgi:hypothetical protein